MAGTLFEDTMAADTASLATPSWQDPFRTWVERNNKWKRNVGMDWTMGQIGTDPYGSQQDWWKDPLQYQWGADTAQEVTDWRVSNPLLSARKQDVLALLGEWARQYESAAGGAAGTPDADPTGTTPSGTVSGDGTQIYFDTGQLSGWHDIDSLVEIGGETFQVGSDGTLRAPDAPGGGAYGLVEIEAFGTLAAGYYAPGTETTENGIIYVLQPNGAWVQKQIETPPVPEAEEIQDFWEWLEEHPELTGFTYDVYGTDEYEQKEELRRIIAAGGLEGDDDEAMEKALAIAAGARGYDMDEEGVGEYKAYLMSWGEETMDDMEGLGEENMAVRDRFNRIATREQEERMMRAMSTFRAGGRVQGAIYAQLDTLNRQIKDTQVQAADQIAKDDMAAREAELLKSQEYYAQAVYNNEMSAAEFMKRQADDRAWLVQEYAKDLSGMIEQNLEYLKFYAADMSAITGGFEMALAAADMALSFAEFDLEKAQVAWTTFMEGEAWEQMKADAEAAGELEGWNAIIEIIGVVLGFAGKFA